MKRSTYPCLNRRAVVPGLLAAMLLGAGSASAGVGVGFGVSYAQVREDLIVPLAFRGVELTLLPLYARRDVDNWHDAAGSFGIAATFDRHGALSALATCDAGYRYLRRVGGAGSDFHLGGAVRWAMDDQNNLYWDDEHLYWLTAISLAPAAGWTRKLKAGAQLDLTLAVPVAAFISRPPLLRFNKTEPNQDPGFYFSAAHQDLRFRTLDRYQAARLGLAWRRPLKRSRFVLSYQCDFARATEPKPVALLTNSVNLTWEFGR